MFRKSKPSMARKTTDIIDAKAPFQFVEAYKSLRTNLDFMTFSGEIKVISVTSTLPDEGKTSVSINLARTLAMSGNKVLLIDADLRNPSIHRYLNVRNVGTGLSSVLSGQSILKEVMYTHEALGIDVILSGPIPPNPSELLMRSKTKEIFDELKEKYDYIIVDTPPAGMITDPKIVAHATDGTLFVIRHRFAKKDVVAKTLRDLNDSETNVLGIVMNNYSASSTDDSYAYAYHYGE